MPFGIPINKKTMTLYVPKGTKKKYKKAYGWSQFGDKIVELSASNNPTAIESVEVSACEDVVYGMDGRRRNALGKGLNIVKGTDGKWKKVLR